MHLLFEFGIAGFVLYLCAFAVCIISLERLYFLFIKYSPWNKDLFLIGLLEILEEERKKPLAIREAHISQEIERVDRMFSKGLVVIRFISVVAPMLGLFGTILGMISIFGAISDTNVPVTPSLISAGLKEALYTTAIGISIAIPSVGINVFFNAVIQSRLQKYVYILNDSNISIDFESTK